jgi:small-conductance mechanosensitive channel
MFSSAYFSQFNRELVDELHKGLTAVSWPGRQFFKQEKWVILVQVLLAFAITIGIRRFRPHLEKMERWQFLVTRPFAVGAFVGVTIATTAYESLPPLWGLVLLTVIGIAAARLAPAFMTKPWGTWLFYGLALIVIDTFFLPYVGMPLPLFRLFIFFVALIGSSLCLWRSVESARRQDSPLYTWTLRLAGLILAVVLVAEIIGYSDFAYYLFEASLVTIYIVLLAWMLMIMARGVLELAVRSSYLQQIQVVREKTALIIARLVLLINLVIVFFLSCYLLETWKIFDSPLAAMQEILSLGFTVGSMRITVGLVLTALACLYGSVLASMTVQVVLSETVFPQRQLKPGVRISVSRLLHYVFVLVGFLLALAVLGVEFRNITIIGGALGVGIGFGLQGIVNNFVSGLILLFERPIKVGDYVSIGNQWGEIKHMGMRATVVQTFDRSEIVVPNSELVSNRVTNWTLSDRFVRLIIAVGVAYGSDVTLVMETLMECAMANSKVMRLPEPQVFFRKFGESALDFELRVWISNVDDRRQTESDLHRDIDQKFRQAGIEIAFPQRDLHLRSLKESPSAALSPLSDPRPDLVVVSGKETEEEK